MFGHRLWGLVFLASCAPTPQPPAPPAGASSVSAAPSSVRAPPSLGDLVHERASCLRRAEQGAPCSLDHVNALRATAGHADETTCTRAFLASFGDDEPYAPYVAYHELLKRYLERDDRVLDALRDAGPAPGRFWTRTHVVCSTPELSSLLLERAEGFSDRPGAFGLEGHALGDLVGCLDDGSEQRWSAIETLARSHSSPSLRGGIVGSLAARRASSERVQRLVLSGARDPAEPNRSDYVSALRLLAYRSPALCADLQTIALEGTTSAHRSAEEAFSSDPCAAQIASLASAKPAKGWTPSPWTLKSVAIRCLDSLPKAENAALVAFATTWATWEKRGGPKGNASWGRYPGVADEALKVCRATNVTFTGGF